MKRHGHARVDPRSPRAFATCDRCSRLFNHDDLHWAVDWRGRNLQNLHLLVCDSCLDVPQEQLRIIVLPPDPLPIPNARPELADIATSGPPVPPLPPVPPPAPQPYFLTAASGSYGITGNTELMRRFIRLPLASGIYTKSFHTTNLDFFPASSAQRAFSAGFDNGYDGATSNPTSASGVFGLTGSSLGMMITRKLPAATGAYAFTGHAANVSTGGLATGVFNIAGHTATTVVTRKLAEVTGAFALTGSVATLIRKYQISGGGVYSISGNALATMTTRKLPAATGSYALTGSTGTLTVFLGNSVTFNPSDKGPQIDLSGNNLTVRHTGGVADNTVRSTTSHSSGKYHVECTIDLTNAGLGVCDSSQSLSDFMGNDIHGVSYYASGFLVFNQNYSTVATATTGDIISMDVDITNKIVWIKINGTNIFGDPVAATGGKPFAAMSTPIFVGTSMATTSTDGITVNFTGPFAYPTTGFGAW